MTREYRTCEVGLNDNDCEALPGQALSIRTTCHRCGGAACKSCSTVRYDRRAKRRIRICRDCAVQEKPGGRRLVSAPSPVPPLLYHGTRAGFMKGGLVLPAHLHRQEARSGHTDGGTEYAYATLDREMAAWYAEQGKGRGKPKVLTVVPLGEVEVDPSPWDGEQDQLRCKGGFLVVNVERVV